MPLTNEDLDAIQTRLVPAIHLKLVPSIQTLLAPIEERVSHLERSMVARFNIVDQNFDTLFKRDEKREQEYLVLTDQVSRLEKRVTKLESKVT